MYVYSPLIRNPFACIEETNKNPVFTVTSANIFSFLGPSDDALAGLKPSKDNLQTTSVKKNGSDWINSVSDSEQLEDSSPLKLAYTHELRFESGRKTCQWQFRWESSSIEQQLIDTLIVHFPFDEPPHWTILHLRLSNVKMRRSRLPDHPASTNLLALTVTAQLRFQTKWTKCVMWCKCWHLRWTGEFENELLDLDSQSRQSSISVFLGQCFLSSECIRRVVEIRCQALLRGPLLGTVDLCCYPKLHFLIYLITLR